VLAEGAKLAGILLESSMLPNGRMAVGIGIGVNVVSHPANTPYPATSLNGMGAACDAEGLFIWLCRMPGSIWRAFGTTGRGSTPSAGAGCRALRVWAAKWQCG
jgi:biotin-(acetyl-CoA carboxylase) ligase